MMVPKKKKTDDKSVKNVENGIDSKSNNKNTSPKSKKALTKSSSAKSKEKNSNTMKIKVPMKLNKTSPSKTDNNTKSNKNDKTKSSPTKIGKNIKLNNTDKTKPSENSQVEKKKRGRPKKHSDESKSPKLNKSITEMFSAMKRKSSEKSASPAKKMKLSKKVNDTNNNKDKNKVDTMNNSKDMDKTDSINNNDKDQNKTDAINNNNNNDKDKTDSANNNNNDQEKPVEDDNLELFIDDMIQGVPNGRQSNTDEDEFEPSSDSEEEDENISKTASPSSTQVSIVDPNQVKKKKDFKCSVCKEIFPNRYFFKKHSLKEHENQVFNCKVCDFSSVYPEKLKNHIIKLHVTKKEKKGTTQQMETELNALMERKLPRKVVMEDGVVLGRTKSSSIGFTCDVCQCVYFSRYCLERHVRSHTGEKPYQCEICEFNTSYHEHMVRHMISVHLVVLSDEPRPKYVPKHKRVKTEEEVEEETNIDPKSGKVRRNITRKRYECAACGLKATHKTDVVEHIKEKHPNAHVESMTGNDGSKIHLIVTANKKVKTQKRLTITCLFCSKVFHDTWKYKVHLRSHTGVRPFRCNLCSFRATCKMTVRDHAHRKHPKDPNARIVIRTMGIDGVADEVEIPIPVREYKCEFCDKQFEDNYAMKTHKTQMHPETQPFSCAACGHREAAKASIMIHCMTEHKDIPVDSIILRKEKPFKVGVYKVPTCDICGKMFGYQSQLYIHQRNHTGERTFNCDNCDYGSNNKTAMENHILKAHLGLANEKKKKKKKSDISMITGDVDGQVEFSCDRCVFVTTEKVILQNHLHKVHGVGSPTGKRGRPKKKTATLQTADASSNTENFDDESQEKSNDASTIDASSNTENFDNEVHEISNNTSAIDAS